jgi:hypothetical protein
VTVVSQKKAHDVDGEFINQFAVSDGRRFAYWDQASHSWDGLCINCRTYGAVIMGCGCALAESGSMVIKFDGRTASVHAEESKTWIKHYMQVTRKLSAVCGGQTSSE